MRVVVLAWSLPWSACPMRMEKNGMASVIMMAAPMMPVITRRRATRAAQRAQSPVGSASTNWPARTARRCARGSTFRPRKLSKAGNSVTDAAMVSATAIAVPMANP